MKRILTLLINSFDEKTRSSPIRLLLKRYWAWQVTDVTERTKRIVSSQVLKDEIVKLIFDNIRNTGLAVLVFWAGSVLYFLPAKSSANSEPIVGGMLMIAGILLLMLNILHGIKKIIELAKPRTVGVIIAAIFYVLVTGLAVATARTKMQNLGEEDPSGQLSKAETQVANRPTSLTNCSSGTPSSGLSPASSRPSTQAR